MNLLTTLLLDIIFAIVILNYSSAILLGLTNHAHSASATDVQNKLRNLLDAISKNDATKTGMYRKILGAEAIREQQAFDTVKDYLQLERHRNVYKRENIESETGEGATAFKREASTPSAISTTQQTVFFPRRELKRFISSSDLQTATGPFADKFVYVDKTKHFSALFKKDEFGQTYFFVRPRRFGRSTFLRTLERIFDGSRHIFNGTYIHGTDYSWDSYPVLYMNLGAALPEDDITCNQIMKGEAHTGLERKVDELFEEFKAKYGLSNPKESSLRREFANILQEIEEKGNSTVVLIDEYDNSILSNLQSCPDAVRINTDLLRDIFLEMNGKSHRIKFAFVTGISKAVFSFFDSAFDLKDITHVAEFHDIAGLTDSDLDKYYGDHVADDSRFAKKSKDTITSDLKNWYKGYKFSESAPSHLYNPSSLHNYFTKGVVGAGMGSRFVFEQMTRRPDEFSPMNLKGVITSRLQGAGSLDKTNAALLLYDAGYLTIHGFENGQYKLKFANREMEEAYHGVRAEAIQRSGRCTDYETGRVASSLLRTVPDFDEFVKAINDGIEKLRTRAPFKNWYGWQVMLFMKAALIPHAESKTKFDISHKKKSIDVTAYNDDIYFLIECKLNKIGNSDAWAAARECVPAFLEANAKKTKPLMLLAAGITFSSDSRKDVVSAYQAKLISPNGTVCEIYDYNPNPNNATIFYRETSYRDFKLQKRPYKKRTTLNEEKDFSTTSTAGAHILKTDWMIMKIVSS